MRTSFTASVKGAGNNTGIEVPAENMAELGTSKRPPVKVNLSGYSYPSTVAVMGGKFMISLSAAHREASGLKAGDEVVVTLELDQQPRVVVVSDDLATALHEEGLTTVFDALAYSKRKEFARQVREAKAPETRERRIAKIVAQVAELQQG